MAMGLTAIIVWLYRSKDILPELDKIYWPIKHSGQSIIFWWKLMVQNPPVQFWFGGPRIFCDISYEFGCKMLQNGEDEKFLSLIIKKLCPFDLKTDARLISGFCPFLTWLCKFLADIVSIYFLNDFYT